MNFRKIRRNLRKDMRGISPVIATLLMIAIAVVASLVVYAWTMGYMNFQQNKVGKAIQIQSVAAPTESSALTVYVQNVGDGSVNLVSGQCLYINGTLMTSSNPSQSILGAGSTASIGATLSANINHGDVFVIKVTSQDGTFSQMTQTVP
jgi:archaeal type IV pilus assembly protein PilA